MGKGKKINERKGKERKGKERKGKGWREGDSKRGRVIKKKRKEGRKGRNRANFIFQLTVASLSNSGSLSSLSVILIVTSCFVVLAASPLSDATRRSCK